MKNRTKKYLLVAGCLIISAVMVVLIANRFTEVPVPDDPIPATDTPAGGVTVSDITVSTGTEPSHIDDPIPIVVKPDITIPADNASGNGAVYKGTEQTIQSDVTKPEYDEKTLKDPTKTPDGIMLDEPPPHVDHEDLTSPSPEDSPSDNTGGSSGGENSGGKGNSGGSSSGGMAGFDNVPNAGENKVITADSDGDINKQVGIMG